MTNPNWLDASHLTRLRLIQPITIQPNSTQLCSINSLALGLSNLWLTLSPFYSKFCPQNFPSIWTWIRAPWYTTQLPLFNANLMELWFDSLLHRLSVPWGLIFQFLLLLIALVAIGLSIWPSVASKAHPNIRRGHPLASIYSNRCSASA